MIRGIIVGNKARSSGVISTYPTSDLSASDHGEAEMDYFIRPVSPSSLTSERSCRSIGGA